MLKHFKMELKRQQEQIERENYHLKRVQVDAGNEIKLNRPLLAVAESQGQVQALNMNKNYSGSDNKVTTGIPVVVVVAAEQTGASKPVIGQPVKRVRGRRSSKPQMEKRRRARINECLDILKSYVLTDSSNLNRLGIDLSASENRDEETIARNILKSSGLINRHRGRKNPNKLEKADILELTVDYVRRLHEQRNELLTVTSNHQNDSDYFLLNQQRHQQPQLTAHCHNLSNRQMVIPAHLSEPLTLDLSPKTRLFQDSNLSSSSSSSPAPVLRAYMAPPNTPLTPPSSGSSSWSSTLSLLYQNNNNPDTNISQRIGIRT